MKILLRVVSGILLLAVIAYFLLYTFRTIKTQDFSVLFSATSFVAMVFAACLYALIIPASASAWAILLKKRDERWSVHLLAAIMGSTQIAKYVPGNVAQHLGRAALSMRYGMSLKTYMVSVLQETLLALAASVFVGMCFLQLSGLGLQRLPEHSQQTLLIFCVLFTLFIFFLSMGAVKLPAFTTKHLSSRWQNFWGAPIGSKATLQVFLLYGCNYLLVGLAMWLVAEALGIHQGNYALFTASFALAWTLGFLAPGAPAGMGVREGVLVLLLAGVVEESRVLTLILAMRLVTIMGDVLCFMIGFVALYRQKRRLNAH